MKTKGLITASILLLALLTLGVVCAEENQTLISYDNSQNDVQAPIEEEIFENENICEVDAITFNESQNTHCLSISPDETITYDDYSEDEIFEVSIPNTISSQWKSKIEVTNIPDDAEGNITIHIDDVLRYNRPVSSNGNTLPLNNLKLDYSVSHNVILNYTGDGKYPHFSKQKTMNPSMSILVASYVEDGETLDVGFNSDLTGTIKILIDNQTVYNKACSKGQPKINLDKYSLATHTYEVIYTKGTTIVSEKGTFTRSKYSFHVAGYYEYDYGDAVEYDIWLPYKAKGTAKLKDKTYSFEGPENELTTITLRDLDIGDNIIEFTCLYKGIRQNITEHIYVKPKLAMPTTLWVNGSYKIRFKASDDFNGNLTLKGFINDTVNVKNGSATFEINNLTCGRYQLHASYANFTWDYKLRVCDETPKIEIQINYPENIPTWDWANDWIDTDRYQINIYSNYDLTGKFTIIHDGKIKELETGYNRVEPDFDAIGNHSISAYYTDDAFFGDMNKTLNYEIYNWACYISPESVSTALPGNEAGTLTVYVNGTKYKTKNIKGIGDIHDVYDIELNGLKYGENYLIKVTFKGKSINFTKTKTLTMTYPFEVFTRDEYKYFEDDKISFGFVLPKDIKAKAVVLIDGVQYKYKKISIQDSFYDWYEYEYTCNGYEVSLTGLKPGKHNVSITYPGDVKYPKKTICAILNVTGDFEMLQDYLYYINSNISLNLLLGPDAVGNLTVEIRYDGEDDYEIYKTVNISNGKATVMLPSDIYGTYEFNAYFKGNYNVENYTDIVRIIPKLTMPSSMNYNENGEITVTIKNATDAKLILYASGEMYEWEIGEFKLNETTIIKIKDLKSKIKAFYKMNNKDTGESTVLIVPEIIIGEQEFNDYEPLKVKFNAKITGLSDMNIYYTDSKYISLKIYDVYGKIAGKNQAVKIKIGKKTFTAKTNAKGVVKFKIPNTITKGKYSVTATYKNAKATKKLTVKQVLTLKTAKVKKSAKKVILTATLKKGKTAIKGKIIKFKFKGKIYKAKTSKKGIAKVTIPKKVLEKLKAGKKITYTATYIKQTVKKTSKVIK